MHITKEGGKRTSNSMGQGSSERELVLFSLQVCCVSTVSGRCLTPAVLEGRCWSWRAPSTGAWSSGVACCATTGTSGAASAFCPTSTAGVPDADPATSTSQILYWIRCSRVLETSRVTCRPVILASKVGLSSFIPIQTCATLTDLLLAKRPSWSLICALKFAKEKYIFLLKCFGSKTSLTHKKETSRSSVSASLNQKLLPVFSSIPPIESLHLQETNYLIVIKSTMWESCILIAAGAFF